MWAVAKRKKGWKDLPPHERIELERRDGVPSLEELQEAVGGYVEGLTLAGLDTDRRLYAFVNETGRLDGLPPTVTYTGNDDGVLVGPVVLTGLDAGGDGAPLTEDELARVRIGPEALVSFTFGTMIPILTIEEA